MRKFGEFDGLADNVVHYINEIVKELEKVEEEDISIYYGYPIIELDRQESTMKCCVVCRHGLVVFYEEENEKTVYTRHFTQIVMSSDRLSELYFEQKNVLESLPFASYKNVDLVFQEEQLLTHEEYKMVNGIIQNVYGMNSADERSISNEMSLGAKIKKRNNAMNMLDQNQFNGIYNKIDSHMRIRGLAGSGKTILLVKKMAYTHFKNRELDLAYVFYTKSLKQYVRRAF